jgi:hypothetical protein
VPLRSQINKHKDTNLSQMPASSLSKLQNRKGGQVIAQRSQLMTFQPLVPYGGATAPLHCRASTCCTLAYTFKRRLVCHCYATTGTTRRRFGLSLLHNYLYTQEGVNLSLLHNCLYAQEVVNLSLLRNCLYAQEVVNLSLLHNCFYAQGVG